MYNLNKFQINLISLNSRIIRQILNKKTLRKKQYFFPPSSSFILFPYKSPSHCLFSRPRITHPLYQKCHRYTSNFYHSRKSDKSANRQTRSPSYQRDICRRANTVEQFTDSTRVFGQVGTFTWGSRIDLRAYPATTPYLG